MFAYILQEALIRLYLIIFLVATKIIIFVVGINILV